MPKRSLLGTLVAICVVAACSDSPTGIEPFEPQFDHNLVGVPNQAIYTFENLTPSDDCFSGAVLIGNYPGHSGGTYPLSLDLFFVGGFFVPCPGDSFGGPSPGGVALFTISPNEVFIELENEALDVSVETFKTFFFDPVLRAYGAGGGDADCILDSEPEVSTGVVTLSVSGCTQGIMKIGLTMPFVLFDNLAITYIADGGSGDVAATAGLSPVADKSLKHNKGRFEVQATCSDAPVTTATATLNAVTVVDGQEVDLRLRSKKKSVKPAKSRKPLRITDSHFTLTVTCGTDIDTAEPVFADKSAKSDKSKKSKKSNKG